MKKIIIINGSAGVGKDTFCEIAKQYASVESISSVDKVKDIARMCGWDGKKDDKSRKFLSDLKYLLSDYNNLPMNYINSCVNFFNKTNIEILFIHIREPKEIDIVKNKYNANTLLINNKNIKHNRSNSADANVHHYVYDYYIDNDGTLEDLQLIVKDFIKKLRNKDGNN